MTRMNSLAAAVLMIAALSGACGDQATKPTSASPYTVSLDSASVERVEWMPGYWHGESEGVRSEEIWLPARGGIMVGVHVDLFDSGSSFFEYLRIEESEGSLVLQASPKGRPATPFVATAIAADRVVFSNLEHDYPQHIAYSSPGPDSLVAEIWGTQDGTERRSRWTWVRGQLPRQ